MRASSRSNINASPHTKRERTSVIAGVQPCKHCGNNPTTIVRSLRSDASAHPAHRAGQRDVVAAQPVRGRFQALRLFDCGHDVLDFRQRPGEACRQVIGQQAECAMPCRTVPARDPRTGRAHASVAPVARKSAAPPRVQRAARKSCQTPTFSGNVVGAGQPRLQPKLHRHQARAGAFLRGPTLLCVIDEAKKLTSVTSGSEDLPSTPFSLPHRLI